MNYKVFHLNCGTMRPHGLFPFSTIPLNATGKWFGRGLGVIHCLLIDSGDGLILIDTGYGTEDINNPTPLVKTFNILIGLDNNIDETALHQIIALGYQADDVKHIFLTHMHLDHNGGLPDFPNAKAHAYQAEYEMAINGKGFETKVYIDKHIAHGPDWNVLKLEGDQWLELERTPIIEINGVEVFYVPMVGHSKGHCIVVVHLPDDRWIIHAGDGYGYHGQIETDKPFFPPFHWLFRPIFFMHPVARSLFIYDEELRRIRKELGDKLEIFNAHDPHEFEWLSGQKIL